MYIKTISLVQPWSPPSSVQRTTLDDEFNRALATKVKTSSTSTNISKTVQTVYKEQRDRNWRVKEHTMFVKGNKTLRRLPKKPVCCQYNKWFFLFPGNYGKVWEILNVVTFFLAKENKRS